MDKNAIKKYAVWARRELIERVSQKAHQYGIEENTQVEANADNIGDKLLSPSEKKERQALIAQIKDKGYEQVMEEVAYTWFNRFTALRFMEVNGYLPSHVRVFTDEENNFKPQILSEAIHLEMDGLDMDKVFALKDANQTDELYKYLLITQCNALNPILPGMFQKIADSTELLFPDNLLREGSVIEQMIALIPEDDWKDAVQIIGWLYQYYNTEPKAKVFSRKSGEKIKKEEIAAATQLFTPDWIVRYMVENSLGRLWLEGHPNDTLKSDWKYYLDEAEQEADVQTQLDKIREEYKKLKPEEIKCIDPCCGSGHILAYMFDVLMQIYEAYGYTAREAAASIVENNIYGLDIDERAAQLAYFSVMMKARQYDRRFFAKKDEDGNLSILQPNVYAVCESNYISKACLEYFVNGDAKLSKEIHALVDEMHNAKEYGSILNIPTFDFDIMFARFEEIKRDVVISLYTIEVTNKLLPLVSVAYFLAQKYYVVVTNPPYMGGNGMGSKLQKFAKKNYPNSKLDLFAVFIEKCIMLTKYKGFSSMITMQSWMFLSSFEKLRSDILSYDIVNMVHLGARAFEEISGEVVQTTSFILRNTNIDDYVGVYERLVSYGSQQEKEKEFLLHRNMSFVKKNRYKEIPDYIFIYWIPDSTVSLFKDSLLEKYVDIKQGVATSDNNRFLRLWFEVELTQIGFSLSREAALSSKYKWFPYNKGGTAVRWYGNQDYVINYFNDGYEMKAFHEILNKEHPGGRLKNQEYYFRAGFTWSTLSNVFAVRYCPQGAIFDTKGSMGFSNSKEHLWYFIALLNSVVGRYWMHILAPTLDFNPISLRHMPVRLSNDPRLSSNVNNCIKKSAFIWSLNEISWDFSKPVLLKFKYKNTIKDSAENAYTQIKKIQKDINFWEKENDQIITKLYDLNEEISSFDDSKNQIIREWSNQEVVASLISYAIGCMFGRYSLDGDGLIYAGGDWDITKYSTFEADRDNVIPICDDEYFEDDIIGRFVKFIEVAYGKDTLQENLKFIADVLGGKGQPKEIIRNYFINDFYKDHCNCYSVKGSGKRPIYWQFDSGKKNGFKCLIYMHRYQPDTLMRIRTDYVHEQQSRYRTAIADLEQRINGAATSERVKLTKKLSKLQEQATEIREYEEKIHHLADQMINIDLDDGVKVNYAKFQDVLAKIK
ncbi:MAG: hypothetical protein PWP20_521 [Eubacteriaceae bacterium]|nr:hypothetical protein [Eubacteriaceae bacterium]